MQYENKSHQRNFEKGSPKTPSKEELQFFLPRNAQEKSTWDLLQEAEKIKLPDWSEKREKKCKTLSKEAEKILKDMFKSYTFYDSKIKEEPVFSLPSLKYIDLSYEVEKLKGIPGAIGIKSPFKEAQYAKNNNLLKPGARLFIQDGRVVNLGHLDRKDATDLEKHVIPYDDLRDSTNPHFEGAKAKKRSVWYALP